MATLYRTSGPVVATASTAAAVAAEGAATVVVPVAVVGDAEVVATQVAVLVRRRPVVRGRRNTIAIAVDQVVHQFFTGGHTRANRQAAGQATDNAGAHTTHGRSIPRAIARRAVARRNTIAATGSRASRHTTIATTVG